MTLLLESGCASESAAAFLYARRFAGKAGPDGRRSPFPGKTPRDPSKFPSEAQLEDPLKKKFLK